MSATPKDDLELVRDLQAGEDWEENARLLHERYAGLVWSSFQREGQKPEECEDLTQEVFLRVFKNIGSFRYQAGVKTWILAIARNLFLNEVVRRGESAPQHRKQEGLDQVERLDPGQLLPAPWIGSEDDPWESAWKRQQPEIFLAAVAELPDRMRQCVLLYYQGRTTKEIAILLGIENETVRSQLHFAKDRLRAKLGPGGPKPPAKGGTEGTSGS